MEMKTKLAALGLSVGLVGGGVAGAVLTSSGTSGASTAVYAQDGSTTTTTPEAGHGQKREDFLRDALAPLVKDGTITQAQADKVIDALTKAAPQGRGFRREGRREVMEAAAGALGMTAADLRTAVQGGQTLAQVATSKGVEPKAVIDAMVAAEKAHLDEAVTAGRMTQAQADDRLAKATERIATIVNDGFRAGAKSDGG